MEVPSKLVTEELGELSERLRAHDAKQHEQQIDCEKRNYLAERAYRAFVCEPRDKRSADNIYGYRTTKDSHVSKCCHKKSAPADEGNQETFLKHTHKLRLPEESKKQSAISLSMRPQRNRKRMKNEKIIDRMRLP